MHTNYRDASESPVSPRRPSVSTSLCRSSMRGKALSIDRRFSLRLWHQDHRIHQFRLVKSNLFFPALTLKSDFTSWRSTRRSKAPSDSTVSEVFPGWDSSGAATSETTCPPNRYCSQPQRLSDLTTHIKRLLGASGFNPIAYSRKHRIGGIPVHPTRSGFDGLPGVAASGE